VKIRPGSRKWREQGKTYGERVKKIWGKNPCSPPAGSLEKRVIFFSPSSQQKSQRRLMRGEVKNDLKFDQISAIDHKSERFNRESV